MKPALPFKRKFADVSRYLPHPPPPDLGLRTGKAQQRTVSCCGPPVHPVQLGQRVFEMGPRGDCGDVQGNSHHKTGHPAARDGVWAVQRVAHYVRLRDEGETEMREMVDKDLSKFVSFFPPKKIPSSASAVPLLSRMFVLLRFRVGLQLLIVLTILMFLVLFCFTFSSSFVLIFLRPSCTELFLFALWDMCILQFCENLLTFGLIPAHQTPPFVSPPITV